MRILIVGTGAIGSFLGGVLHRFNQDVTFFDLPQVVERLQTSGIRVEGVGEEIHIQKPKVLSSLQTVEMFDLAIFAVKSYSTRVASNNVPEDVALRILTFQNGIGNEEILAERFGKQKVIAGSITYPVSYPEPGHVKIENPDAGMGMSAMEPALDIDDVVEAFSKAGLNVVTAEDYRSLKWSKLILNIICNATCAILGMTPGEVFADQKLVHIERAQVLEALNVMRKKKIPAMNLPGYPVKLLASVYELFPSAILKLIMQKRIAGARGEKKPSLLLDLEKGLKVSEVSFLNGAIYQQGANVALPLCFNKVIYETLEDIASGTIPWETFKGKPAAFNDLFKKCH